MNEWISVKDRLPNNGQRVLIYCKEIDEVQVGIFVDQNKTFILFEMWNISIEHVTHWCEIPEPPKEND